MIGQRELINRQNNNIRRCVAFDYVIRPEDRNRKQIVVRFAQSVDDERVWTVAMSHLGASDLGDVRTFGYSLDFVMPMGGMPLTMVCAYGLRALAGAIGETMQEFSAWEFVCYDVTKDM